MEKPDNCSFCGRDKKDVQFMLSGLEANICDNCIEKGNQILEKELNQSSDKQSAGKQLVDFTKIKPAGIKEHLDQYVIGQDDAKKVLSVAVYNHYKRLNQKGQEEFEDVNIEKSNVIVIGETGTGKTYLAKTIADILEVPFCIADATVVTESGYVGEDVESILSRLYQAAGEDANATQQGIVYIDEIDKIARKGDNASITRDVSGEGVQQALLKLLEGSKVNIPPAGGRKHPEQKYVEINTDNILFICGGAFVGLEDTISSRLNQAPIGFKSRKEEETYDNKNLLQYVTALDLKQYGLIPELIGRLPVITHLDPMNEDMLKQILTVPRNAITKQFQKLFKMEGINLEFEEKALDYIVEKAMDYKLGARGLRSICEVIMNDLMFELPSQSNNDHYTVTYDLAVEKIEKSKFGKLKQAS